MDGEETALTLDSVVVHADSDDCSAITDLQTVQYQAGPLYPTLAADDSNNDDAAASPLVPAALPPKSGKKDGKNEDGAAAGAMKAKSVSTRDLLPTIKPNQEENLDRAAALPPQRASLVELRKHAALYSIDRSEELTKKVVAASDDSKELNSGSRISAATNNDSHVASGPADAGPLRDQEEPNNHGSFYDSISESIQPLPPPGATTRGREEAHLPGAYAVSTRMRERHPSDTRPPNDPTEAGFGPFCPPQVATDLSQQLMEADPVDEEAGVQVAEEYDENSVSTLRQNKDRALVLKFVLFGLALLIMVVILVPLLFHKKGDTATNRGPANHPASINISTTTTTTTNTTITSLQDRVLSLLPTWSVNEIQTSNESAQMKAYQWLLKDPSIGNYSDGRLLQRFSLVAFFYSTQGGQWTKRDNWLNYRMHECGWFSKNETNTFPIVTTDYESPCKKRDANAKHNKLSDELYYTRLWLHENQLQGDLPKELYLLTSLTSLSLYGNPDLKGTISTNIAQLTSLDTLYIASLQQLTGSIPTEVGLMSQLTDLQTFYTGLTGAIPSELGLLSNLQYLKMDSSFLSGHLPSELGMLSNCLLFYTAANAISGSIPSELGQLSNVNEIWLHDNLMTGKLPTEVTELSNLTHFWVHKNMLTGSIPSLYGQFPSLVDLVMEDNQLNGTIPTEIANLSDLIRFRMKNCSLTGSLPSQFGQLSYLTNLNVILNQLTGTIPKELWSMSNLRGMHLSGNYITGSISTSIVNMEKLRNLWLSNVAWGTLPSEIGTLSDLRHLILDDTNLAGTIPSQFGQLSSLQKLYIRNSFITGTLPSELGLLTRMDVISLELNNISGSIPEELSSLATNASLVTMNVTGNALLFGTVPDALCLMTSGIDDSCPISYWWIRTKEECGLAFDCTNRMCGCDCACKSPEEPKGGQ